MNYFKINRTCSLQQLSLNPGFVDPTNSKEKNYLPNSAIWRQVQENQSYSHFIDETTEAQKGKFVFVRLKPTNETLSLAASSSGSKVRISRTLIS